MAGSPGAITITCDAATSFASSNLSYSNNGLGACLIAGQVMGVITGTFNECGGTLTQTWTFTDNCNRTIQHVQTISVDPAPIAAWINAPSNITITCDAATSFTASNLAYTNNGLGACLISGQVMGVITGSFTECGGTLTQTWIFTDNCNRTITHVQTITVDPAPIAAWQGAPGAITITCDQATSFIASNLSYSNNGLGACLISGQVMGVITGSFTECGGTLTQTWTFTDNCNRTITHVQTITVDPAPIAAWLNAPSNITITCDAATSFSASNLSYSNNGLGACLISGQVMGVITGTFTECGGSLTQTWTFTDNCNRTITHVQTITVDPAPIAAWQGAPGAITITCDQATSFAASNLSYSNNGLGACLIAGQVMGVITGTFTECGGTLTQTWTFTDNCNRTIQHVQTITVDPAPIAAWINAPSNITITCDAATSFAASNLSYSNNGLGACLISGQVMGVITGTFNECGGTLTQTWTFTDNCNRTITHVQTISVDPAPIASWINAPSNITITCDQATSFTASNLSYTNNGLGACLISGQVMGVITGTFTECGGTLTQTWTFTDNCNRTITHVQTISVDPAPIAAWINAPSNITITCDAATSFAASNLSYTNNGLGACLISGQVMGVITGSFTECGGTLTQTWTFTDNCNRTIQHIQTITVDPAPIASWINAPSNITITCDAATSFAASNLSYSNNGLGACLISGQVMGVITGTFNECGGTLTQTWTFTDNCNRTITHVQTITVDPAPIASWQGAPGAITITCDAATSFTASNLAYSNNGLGACLISGQVMGVITGSFTECGGTLTQTWTFTDNCNRTITHVQTITVDPAPIAAWQGAPGAITITCDAATSFSASNLAYTNNGLGACLISGQVMGVITGSFTECGGTLTQTWTFTDNCNRTIQHVQTITVDPAPIASWLGAPGAIIITCDAATSFTASNLSYNNNGLGACLISGQVMGVITGSFTECGGILTQTWTFTDNCNRTIQHVQPSAWIPRRSPHGREPLGQSPLLVIKLQRLPPPT
jgi:hypothetical protein